MERGCRVKRRLPDLKKKVSVILFARLLSLTLLLPLFFVLCRKELAVKSSSTSSSSSWCVIVFTARETKGRNMWHGIYRHEFTIPFLFAGTCNHEAALHGMVVLLCVCHADQKGKSYNDDDDITVLVQDWLNATASDSRDGSRWNWLRKMRQTYYQSLWGIPWKGLLFASWYFCFSDSLICLLFVAETREAFSRRKTSERNERMKKHLCFVLIIIVLPEKTRELWEIFRLSRSWVTLESKRFTATPLLF